MGVQGLGPIMRNKITETETTKIKKIFYQTKTQIKS